MTTVSQRVPTLLLGISQQPDFKKIPGQLVDALNAYPDFVNGLVKRPGAEFFGEMIQPGTDPDKSFLTNIIRDSTEKYVLQYDITAEQFKVWKHPNPRVIETVFDTPPLLEQQGVLHTKHLLARIQLITTQQLTTTTQLCRICRLRQQSLTKSSIITKLL